MTQSRIARRLKSLRIDKGMTQEELAAASGLSESTISSLEAGRRGMTLETAYALAAALGCSIDEIACREEPARID